MNVSAVVLEGKGFALRWPPRNVITTGSQCAECAGATTGLIWGIATSAAPVNVQATTRTRSTQNQLADLPTRHQVLRSALVVVLVSAASALVTRPRPSPGNSASAMTHLATDRHLGSCAVVGVTANVESASALQAGQVRLVTARRMKATAWTRLLVSSALGTASAFVGLASARTTATQGRTAPSVQFARISVRA